MNSKIGLIRHGDAKYESIHSDKRGAFSLNQFLYMFEGAEDLEETRIQELTEYFEDYINTHIKNLKEKRIDIWISPFGRTIHTGYIFLELLKKNNIKVKKICIFERIGEIQNFDWNIFQSLVKGGTIEIDGKTVNFNKTLTNPENLSASEYLFSSYWLKINPSYLKILGIYESINKIESFESITQRSQKILSRLLNIGTNKAVFIFSHQAFSDWIIKGGEKYENGGQNPGEIIHIGNNLFLNPNDYERYQANGAD